LFSNRSIIPIAWALALAACIRHGAPAVVSVQLPPACPDGTQMLATRLPSGSRWRCLLPSGLRQGPLVAVVEPDGGVVEANYLADRKQGPFRYWYANGLKGAEGSYVTDKPEGSLLVWDDAGHRRASCRFDEGAVVSERSRLWDESGFIVEGATCDDRTMDSVGAVLASVHDQVKDCYESALANNAKLAGRIDTAFTIDPTGFTRAAKITADTMGDPAVQDCLIGILERLIFPPSLCCDRTEVTYPWIFKTTR